MQLDSETIRWVLSGIFCVGGGLISWLLARQVGKVEADIEAHDIRIKETQQLITTAQIDLAKNYVSKIELEKTLDTHIAPLRSDMRDIKDDLKSLLKRP